MIEDTILNREGKPDAKHGLLIARTAKQCLLDASLKPIPKMLFSQLWHEYELCILFADTNVGKSILAVQIADQISRGKSNGIFKVEAVAQVVLYFDFELSDKQFEKRYSAEYTNHYDFHENFLRVEINPDYDQTTDFETEIERAIEQQLNDTGGKVLILDNITFLKTQSTDTAREALPLMNMLVKLKKKYGISILALAHTPKRDHYKPISVNDLAGSKHISNFADSIFAIGQSIKDPAQRYLKQIKARATEKFYDTDYVIICKIEKDTNFLGFTHIGFGDEREHLRQVTEKESNELDQQILELHTESPTMSFRQIAEQLATNHKKVSRVIERNNQ